MSVIDATKRFLNQDDSFHDDELLTMTYRGLFETIEHTMQDTLIVVLEEGDEAWMEFGQELRRLHNETIKD